jgi:hypothetical protein
MQSVEHSPEAQTLGMEAKGVPGLRKATKPSTEHSQSEKHWPSGQTGIDSDRNTGAFEPFSEGMAGSTGFNPGAQSQSGRHWPSGQGMPNSACNAGFCSLFVEAIAKFAILDRVSQSHQEWSHMDSGHGTPQTFGGPAIGPPLGWVGGRTGELSVPLLHEKPFGHSVSLSVDSLVSLVFIDTLDTRGSYFG